VVGHHLKGFLAGEEAVLDAVDPGPDAGPYRLVADRVRFTRSPSASC